LLDALKQRSTGRRKRRGRDFVYAVKMVHGFGSDQGVIRGGAQFFQSRTTSRGLARRQLTDPNPKLLRVARKFTESGFEELRQCLKTATKGQNQQKTGFVKPDMLWHRAHASCVYRKLENKFVPRTCFTQSAQIMWLQGKIALPDSRRQFGAEPLEQAIPIVSESKRLDDRLATNAGVIVSQWSEKGERGGEIASLCEREGSEQIGLPEQAIRGVHQAKRAEESPGRAVALPRGELRCFSQSNRGREDQDKPRTATDKSGCIGLQDPRCSGDQQDRERGNTPAAIQSATSPGLSEQDERRNAGDEEKNMVQIEHGGGNESR
jgi:hypothetical protein